MTTVRSWVCWLIVVLLPLEALALAGRHLCERGHVLASPIHATTVAAAGSHEEGCPHAKGLPAASREVQHEAPGATAQSADAAQPAPGDALHSSCDACGACVLMSLPGRSAIPFHVASSTAPPSDDLRFSSAWLALIEPPPRA